MFAYFWMHAYVTFGFFRKGKPGMQYDHDILFQIDQILKLMY